MSDQTGPKTQSVDPEFLAGAISRLTHCAHNDAAHFGGRYGMFVDVPVRDLKAVLVRLHEMETQVVSVARAMQDWVRG